MASLKQNVEQAISDFDAIKAALEDSGIEVPYGTDTSEYGNLVKMLGEQGSSEILIYVDKQLENKVDKVDGARLMTEEEGQQLAELVKSGGGGTDNLIETVKIGDVELPVTDKTISIPIAAGEFLGVVKGATGENKVSVSETGEMYISVINLNTLVQSEGDELVLNGGSSF